MSKITHFIILISIYFQFSKKKKSFPHITYIFYKKAPGKSGRGGENRVFGQRHESEDWFYGYENNCTPEKSFMLT